MIRMHCISLNLDAVHPHRFFDDNSNVNPDIAIPSMKAPSRSRFKALGIEPVHIDWDAYELDDGQAAQIMGFGCSKEGKNENGRSISSAHLQIIYYCSGWQWLSLDTAQILCFTGQSGTECGIDYGGPILM